MPAVPPPPHPTYSLEQVIRAALEEDAAGVGDITTLATIRAEDEATATLLSKADGILAGQQLADAVLRLVDARLVASWDARDGDTLRRGQRFATIRGPAHGLLVAERVVLNFMQRMSGIATATAAMAAAAAPARVLETRKTAPGLRVIDKWAVLIGGGCNHRMGLFDMVMIKDNHIAAAGGITAAVGRAREYLRDRGLTTTPIEVETSSLDEVREVLRGIEAARQPAPAGDGRGPPVTRIMLDNMSVEQMTEAVALIAGAVETEASGNVTLENIGRIAATGVTFISSGALTHSVKALDISLNIEGEWGKTAGLA